MSFIAKFTQGDISAHIMKMALTNAIGLSVFFMVDLVDIYFISLLGKPHLVAAIAYAGGILFFTTSLSIAMVIANSAVVAKKIGQQSTYLAKQAATTCCILTFIYSSLLAFLIYYNAENLLRLIGARGDELSSATLYLRIVVFSFPILALAMQMTATLRALGDAKLGMLCTLFGGLANALIDPLLIFHFNFGFKGAAFATVIARTIILIAGLYFLLRKYHFLVPLQWAAFKQHAQSLCHVAFPASLTQISTPIGQLYVTYEMAKFGGGYVAGWAIISRLIPITFVMLFAMPGAIGPILSQNIGAKQYERVKSTLNQSLNFIIKYVLVLALLLSFLQDHLILLFNAQSDAALLIRFFCQYIAISFIFVAMSLVAMSFLNNVGYAKTATFLNIGKMSLGTIPFVSVGAFYYGAEGVLIGQAIGSIVFGLIALALCYRIFLRVQQY